MTANQTRFINTVGVLIEGLCRGAAGSGTAAAAKTWYMANVCPQPKGVNQWMASVLQPHLYYATWPPSLDPSWADARAYLASFDSKVQTLINATPQANWPAYQYVAQRWFQDAAATDGTSGEIPTEVLDWANANLPDVCAEQMIEAKPSAGETATSGTVASASGGKNP